MWRCLLNSPKLNIFDQTVIYSENQLKQCLDSAISQEDKKSCAERHEAQAKVCEKGECEIERAKNTNRNDVLPQKK